MPAPADPGAAERRTRALEMLVSLPELAPAEARTAARDIADKIDQADQAKHAFEVAEGAHLIARFDREKLQACHDATTRYGVAENTLTLRVEELAAAAAVPAPFDGTLPTASNGETEGAGGGELSASPSPNDIHGSASAAGSAPPPETELSGAAGGEGASASLGTDGNETTKFPRSPPGQDATGIAGPPVAVAESPEAGTSTPEEQTSTCPDARLAPGTEAGPVPVPVAATPEREPGETADTTDEEPGPADAPAFIRPSCCLQ
jgi:hypothetical protein